MANILKKVKNLYEEQKYDEIKKVCDKYFKFNPEKTCDRFNVAHFLIRDINMSDYAVSLLETLINSESRNYATRLLISKYMQDGKYDRAKELGEYSLDFDSKSNIYLKLAKIAKNEGRYEDAQKYLELGMKCDDYKDSKYALEEILLNLKLGNIDKVIEIINKNKFIKYDSNFNIIFDMLTLKYGYDYEISDDGYFSLQFKSYDEKRAKKYLKNYKSTSKFYLREFYNGVNSKELFDYCKDKIQTLEPVNCNHFDNYIIELDYPVGQVEGFETNFVVVKTLLNEKNIMEIMPTIYFTKNERVGRVEPVYKYEYKPKSQIDKFNERYAKNI